jgi:hypothetical protein
MLLTGAPTVLLSEYIATHIFDNGVPANVAIVALTVPVTVVVAAPATELWTTPRYRAGAKRDMIIAIVDISRLMTLLFLCPIEC